MPIVFEEPPGGYGGFRGAKERSPERKEMDELLGQLTQYPDQWARLFDFPDGDKEGAEKHAGKVRSAAGYLNTGKSWSVAVRQTPQGWSIFAKMSSDPARKRAPKKDEGQPEQQPEQPEPGDQPYQPQPAPEPDQVREPTFQ